MPLIEQSMSEAEKRRAVVARENWRPLPQWMWEEGTDYVRYWHERTGRFDETPDADDMAEIGIYVSDQDPEGILSEAEE